MPILHYGLEVCCLNRIELNSLVFVINRFCINLFRTSNVDTIKDCRASFNTCLQNWCINVIIFVWKCLSCFKQCLLSRSRLNFDIFHVAIIALITVIIVPCSIKFFISLFHLFSTVSGEIKIRFTITSANHFYCQTTIHVHVHWLRKLHAI